MTGRSPLADVFIPSPAHDGPFAQGQPRLIVIHSIECPLQDGYAKSLAAGWMQHSGVSVHYIVGPDITVQTLDEGTIGWGAGTVNSAAIHIEQTGYAHYTRDQWLTDAGQRQIDRVRKLVADIAGRHNIPLRFTTDQQLVSAWKGNGPGGVTTHAQCTKDIGGTTHTDPGIGYPLPLLLSGGTPEMDGSKKVEATDYRGRFTSGDSPTVDYDLQHYLVNGWEFTKYNAGRLDALADAVSKLTDQVAALKGDTGGNAAGTYTGTLKLKKG